MTRLSWVLPLLLLTAASPASTPASAASAPAPGSTSGPHRAQFVERSVTPGDDFFKFAVGKWLKDNPMPANERSWGIGHVVQEETYRRVMSINEESAANRQATPGSTAQKIGDFWLAAMDTATNAQQGFAPPDAEVARLAAIKDRQGLLDVVGPL